MKNVIQFKKGFINISTTGKGSQKTYSMSMTLAAELMQFGYILTPDAISSVSLAEPEEIEKLYNELITFLKKATGSERSHTPFWKGFPAEVMEQSEADLWINQILHYISDGSYFPDEFTKARATAFENPKYTMVDLGNEEMYLQIFTDLVSGNQSLTPDDLDTVKYFVSSGETLKFPDSIPFKENLCTLAGMGLDIPVKTTTDVLRIAVHLSGGDVSLPKVPSKRIKVNVWSRSTRGWKKTYEENPERTAFKFKKFKRAERKYILSLLEKTNCDVREMKLKIGRWLRLGEILHPGEYKSTFPRSYKVFDLLRNEKVTSWYGEVDAAFKASFDEGLLKLTERPGEFLRRLDMLIRNSGENRKKVLDAFEKVGINASNKVLYESYGHFANRETEKPNRTIMVKGSRSRTELTPLPAMEKELVENIQVSILEVLRKKFSTLESLGKVWINEELKKIPLPTNMRSMNSALKPAIRGQRIPMGNQDAKVIRAYVHWFDERGSRDIDLTATLIGMGSGNSAIIGWNGLHNCTIGCYSGDIRHVQGACAEYIDIDIQQSLAKGLKYAILDARNYNGGSLAEITDCVFGYMEREFPVENEIFVPATLANSVRLQSASSSTIVAMIDLETQEYIFMDIDQDGIPVASAQYEEILDAIKPYMEMPKFSVYDLLKLHTESRGTLVLEKEEAETVLDEQFTESYTEIIKWMGV
jgi:hypothetical protein